MVVKRSHRSPSVPIDLLGGHCRLVSIRLTAGRRDALSAAGCVIDVAWGSDGKTFVISDRASGLLVYAASLLSAKTDAEWLTTAEQ
jgi:hypothetical protein